MKFIRYHKFHTLRIWDTSTKHGSCPQPKVLFTSWNPAENSGAVGSFANTSAPQEHDPSRSRWPHHKLRNCFAKSLLSFDCSSSFWIGGLRSLWNDWWLWIEHDYWFMIYDVYGKAGWSPICSSYSAETTQVTWWYRCPSHASTPTAAMVKISDAPRWRYPDRKRLRPPGKVKSTFAK